MNSRQRTKPMLVDHSLNVALSIKYFIYALFGLSGFIVEIPSVAEVAGSLVAQILGIIVFVSGIAAGVSTLNSLGSVRWEKAELYTTIVLISFVGIYNACLIYLTFASDEPRVNLAIIATALLVTPIWKISWILKKNRNT